MKIKLFYKVLVLLVTVLWPVATMAKPAAPQDDAATQVYEYVLKNYLAATNIARGIRIEASGKGENSVVALHQLYRNLYRQAVHARGVGARVRDAPREPQPERDLQAGRQICQERGEVLLHHSQGRYALSQRFIYQPHHGLFGYQERRGRRSRTITICPSTRIRLTREKHT